MTIEKQIQQTYLRHGKENLYQHVQAVAAEAERIAEIYGQDREKARIAGLLHDISAIISPQQMYELICQRKLPLDPAEEKYPFLLHQRVSRIMAAENFAICDEEILSAIECHTTLKAAATPFDQLIFIADKIAQESLWFCRVN